MFINLRQLDNFSKNIIFVFLGSFLASFLTLVYQLFIAHKFPAEEFAAFNSLIAVYMLIATPLTTLQLTIAKFSSGFKARGETDKVKTFISAFLKISAILAVVTFFLFVLFSFFVTHALKIDSPILVYILSFLLSFAWISPVLVGSLQGLERFGWLVSSVLLNGIIKLGFAVFFVLLGFKIAGAIGAFLVSVLCGIIAGLIPLRKFLRPVKLSTDLNYKEIFSYLLPLFVSSICFIWLVNIDMILVRYFFAKEVSGSYALAQMLGKIFLFLPSAISVVMFPRTSGLNAVNSDTRPILKRVLFYAACLLMVAVILYNAFPGFVLKVLTGKSPDESILLGRLFSISMTFFALGYVLINYFLSLRKFIFIKYLVLSVGLELIGIFLFHNNLIEVQSVLCINAALLFGLLAYHFKTQPESSDYRECIAVET